MGRAAVSARALFTPDPRDTRRHGTIYLLHFSAPLQHARHYMGFVEGARLAQRMQRHALGTGSKLMAAVGRAGLSFVVARLWQGTRADERRLKRRKGATPYCPICAAAVGRTASVPHDLAPRTVPARWRSPITPTTVFLRTPTDDDPTMRDDDD